MVSQRRCLDVGSAAIVAIVPTLSGKCQLLEVPRIVVSDLLIVVLGQACFMVCIAKIGHLSLYMRS